MTFPAHFLICNIFISILLGLTGAVNGDNVNGWFIGFLEKDEHIYCFATNLQNSEGAAGSTAAKITMAILNDM